MSLLRFLVFLLIFFSPLSASYIEKMEIYGTKEKNVSIEEAKAKNAFKITKLPIIRHEKGDYFIRVTLDERAFEKNETYILEFFNEFNVIEIEKGYEKLEIFRHAALEFKGDNVPKSFIIKMLNDERYILFDLKVYKKNVYVQQELLYSNLFGLSYGVIFTAFLYYLALYLFNREKTHIYYSLTQLSMLGILLVLSFADETTDEKYLDIIFIGFFIFSNLFTQYFLNTKKRAPFIHKILVGLIYIYVLDVIIEFIFGISFLEDNIPMSFLLFTYLIAGFQAYQKEYKPALFYLIGWGIVIISFMHIEAQMYIFDNILIMKPIYIIHLTTPLESLILAFALSYKMKMLEEQKNEQKEFVIHQSKLASMGEMLGNIAHQWRQPLTHLSYIMMNLKTAYEKDRLSKEYFDKKTKEATAQLEYMSHTIDDFRDFFKVSKLKEKFSLQEALDEVINLFHASLESKNIQLKRSYEDDIIVNSYKGEFLQVIFNLLNNAKDELIRNEIDNATISIGFKKEKNNTVIEVLDNAGGIKNQNINKIFEPYFTTKDQGLGLGLYMSKMIVEQNMQGILSVKNEKEGALFSIKIKP